MDETRYDRQQALFGMDGQCSIQAKRVAIVGLGGIGSHVAQQLAHLGVVDYALIDPDVVSTSSLNRLIGSIPEDATDEHAKIAVSSRMIRTIQPQATITEIASPLESDQAREAINGADLVLGCVDSDTTRLRLTELCARYAKPYLDLATDTGGEGDALWYGGHVLFTDRGDRCSLCMGLLDQRALARAAMTPERRAEDDRIYGIARDALGETGPAVVSFNGVIASLGVTEFMVWATGLREPWPLLVYRADLGRVTLRTDPPAQDCYYCKGLWGRDASPEAGSSR